MAETSDTRIDQRLWLAVALSLLLHLVVAVVLLSEPWGWRRPPAAEQQVLLDMVFPEAPKPSARPARPAASPEMPPLPPASVPQLQRAPLAEESKTPPGPAEAARRQPQASPEPQPRSEPRPDLRGPNRAASPLPQQRAQSERQAGSREAGQGRAAGAPGPAMTQSESDFFLSQVVAAWAIDFDAPQFRNIQIYGHYRVLPDGMLAPPFGRNDPWDMHAMVNNWHEIEDEPRAAAFRTAIETFLRAMRLAQPFAMPPDAQGYPKILSLNFRIGDL